MHIDKEIHYKELVHVIVEADKTQDLLFTSWRPRRAGGVRSSLKAFQLKTQEELMFQFESRGRKKPMSQLQGQTSKRS